jgi:hypothetical protein
MDDGVRPPGPVTRTLIRLTTDRQGNVHAIRLLGIAALAAMFVAIGTSAALVSADAGNPATLTIWVLVSFLAVKVPLLALLWWLLGRAPRDEDPRPDELRAMLVRLSASAETAMRSPDAADRLAILRDEAWFVADRVPDDARAEALELALRLDEAARAAGADGAPASSPAR